MERGAITPTNLRAAWWAFRMARRTRRLLDSGGLEAAIGPPPPPELPDQGIRGVRGALRRRGESCLVKSIVIQSWDASHGRRRDLIIGVTTPSEFGAHAWLDGDTAMTASKPYEEILRRELPSAWPGEEDGQRLAGRSAS